MSRYAVIVLLIVLFLIRALGGNDDANAPVVDEFDSDVWWYDTDPDLRGVKIIGWVAVGFAVFICVAGLTWEYKHPPPPPVDATASVDELEPSPGMPNQFIGFASSGKIGSEWGDFRGIDDGISPNYEEGGVKSELAVLQAELECMKTENQHLRDLLNQVTNNYYTLQMHLVTLMQQQNQKVAVDELEQAGDHATNNKVDQVVSQHSTSGTNMLLRQFIDLGLGGPINSETEQEPSLSMLEGGDPS